MIESRDNNSKSNNNNNNNQVGDNSRGLLHHALPEPEATVHVVVGHEAGPGAGHGGGLLHHPLHRRHVLRALLPQGFVRKVVRLLFLDPWSWEIRST